uniref:Uncharacterized protein n=1 Tax=Setaria digitata TaxID=48799 RepID=A0A915PQM4_9BILA
MRYKSDVMSQFNNDIDNKLQERRVNSALYLEVTYFVPPQMTKWVKWMMNRAIIIEVTVQIPLCDLISDGKYRVEIRNSLTSNPDGQF